MKLYKIKVFFAIGSVMLLAGACKKSFYSDINTNPNVVNTVSPNFLLPSVEIALAFTQGGDFSRYSSMLTQQAFGQQNQTQTFYQYGINPGTFENGWGDMYTSVMENDYALMLSADANGKTNEYAGISRIIMAYCLQLVVDDWGSVPYSEALKGNVATGTIQPKYDDAAALYDTCTTLIDAGIALLNNTSNDVLTPGSTEDPMYGGTTSSWIAFGHAIKARLYIHQSKGNATMAASALTEAASAMTTAAGSAIYPFAGGGTTQNPWFQFMNDRAAYISFDNVQDSLIKFMTAENDPRVSIFTDGKGGLGAYYGGSASAPVELITYDEMLFLQAEATLRNTGSIADAQVFYQNGIKQSMLKLGVSATASDAYVTTYGTLPGTVDAAIATVSYEEFKALFLNPEAWTLWRRTGSPALTSKGAGAVPRRLIYPQSEYSYNAANVPASTLYTPAIFWDK